MIRVHVICEGQTEEMFIKELLSSSFESKGIWLIPALVGKPGHKGGNIRIERLLTDVRNRLLGDQAAYCTTFFDFYGLPAEFPGKAMVAGCTTSKAKAKVLCQALTEALTPPIGLQAMRRFIPYVQMFEFEALLFSDPAALARGIGHENLGAEFRMIRSAFDSPESINDSPRTAPSKRIIKKVEDYEKPIYGTMAAMEIGLPTMRKECALFDKWLKRIEGLAKGTKGK